MTVKCPDMFRWRVVALDWVTQQRTSTEVWSSDASGAMHTASDVLRCPVSAIESVVCHTGHSVHIEKVKDLTNAEFFRGYIQALGFTGRSVSIDDDGDTNCDEPAFEGSGDFDQNWDVWEEIKDVISDADLIQIWTDIEGFFYLLNQRPQAVIDEVSERVEKAGIHFCFTRQGQGAGFWDGDWEHGDELTKLSKSFGTYDMEVLWAEDEDGRRVKEVYFHG